VEQNELLVSDKLMATMPVGTVEAVSARFETFGWKRSFILGWQATIDFFGYTQC